MAVVREGSLKKHLLLNSDVEEPVDRELKIVNEEDAAMLSDGEGVSDDEPDEPQAERKGSAWINFVLVVVLMEVIFSWVVALILYGEKQTHLSFVNGETLTENTTVGIVSGRAGLSLFHEFDLLVCAGIFSLVKLAVVIWAFKISPQKTPEHPWAEPVRDAFSRALFGVVDISTLVCVVLDIICFSYPNSRKTVLRGVTMAVRVVFMLRTRTLVPPTPLTVLNHCEDVPKQDPFHRMLLVQALREVEVTTRHRREHRWFLRVTFWWVFIFIVNLGTFLYQNGSQVGGFFPDKVLDEMNNVNKTQAYFGNSYVSNQRVVIVLLDGFRYDQAIENSRFSKFLQSDVMANDSKLFKIKAQLPSMSVPNWVVTVTGVKPEITGILGNVNIPEIQFDSIYAQASTFKKPTSYFMRGVVGSPWFGEILESKLPGLEGDARVSTSYGANGRGDTADAADAKRSATTVYALARNETPYKLWLVHYSDIDQQGHFYGVKQKYNKDDTYTTAVNHKTAHLEDMMNVVVNHPQYGENTVVFITADHGHVDPGGHGGIAPVMRDIPLVVWKKNSGLRHVVGYDGPGYPDGSNALNRTQELENTFIAPTVCALLGIPVPRQNQGQFINELMPFMNQAGIRKHVEDLYRQKQIFIGKFLVEAGLHDTKLREYADDKLFSTRQEDYDNRSTEELIRDTKRILDIYEQGRADAMNQAIARNFVVSVLFSAVLFCVFMHLLTRKTFGLFMPAFLMLYGKASDLVMNGHFQVYLRYNKLAFRDALLGTAGYVAWTVSAYNIVYGALGYGAWDSTVMHHPHVLPLFAAVSLVPGIIGQLVLTRILHWHALRSVTQLTPTIVSGRVSMAENPMGTDANGSNHLNQTAPRGRKNACKSCMHSRCAKLFIKVIGFEWLMSKPSAVRGDVLKNYILLIGDSSVNIPSNLPKGVGYSYLVRLYLIILGLILGLSLLIAQSIYGFILPTIYDVGLISEHTWLVRFRVLTIQIMMVPFLVGNFLFAKVGPPWSRYSTYSDELLYFFLVKSYMIFQILGSEADGYEQFQRDWTIAIALLKDRVAHQHHNLGKHYADQRTLETDASASQDQHVD